MALVFNTVDTPVSPAPTRSLVPASLNFAADYRVAAELPGEVVLTNITAPLAQPETIRIAYQEVNDVFKGTKIDAPLSGNVSSKKGTSILVQLNGAGEDDQSFNVFPYSLHLVLKLPNGCAPTAAQIKGRVERMLGVLYETLGDDPDDRIDAIVRGALTPVDL